MKESNTKLCRCCGGVKELAAFCKDKSTKDGKRPYCRACEKIKRQQHTPEQWRKWGKASREKNRDYLREKSRELYAANPEAGRKKQQAWRDENRERLAEKWKETRRRTTLASYGLTPEQYEALLVSQEGLCAICATDDPQHWSGKFQVDHAHDSGRVRGLLCASCNGGMGLFRDDPERLLKAVSYLVNARDLTQAEFLETL